MSYDSFEDLDVWKACREYRKSISTLCISLPPEEKYRLKDQLIRSSRSITANIAEGHGIHHYLKNIQFCRQAKGSLSETLDHLIVAYDDGYISELQLNEFRKSYEKCRGLLNGYIRYLKTKKSEE
jgi:four helix bundle protein